MIQKKFDPAKPCQTRSGNPIRILCTDAPGGKPIIGLNPDGRPFRWTVEGCYFEAGVRHDSDLVNTPTKHTRWVYVWRNSYGQSVLANNDYPTKDDAQIACSDLSRKLVKLIPIEWED